MYAVFVEVWPGTVRYFRTLAEAQTHARAMLSIFTSPIAIAYDGAIISRFYRAESWVWVK